jgi:hypothetical protein
LDRDYLRDYDDIMSCAQLAGRIHQGRIARGTTGDWASPRGSRIIKSEPSHGRGAGVKRSSPS